MIRYRLTNQLAATFNYLYEPFRVYDFAFDPTVVDSIVQPSSLVLGYVYRPYTAHPCNSAFGSCECGRYRNVHGEICAGMMLTVMVMVTCHGAMLTWR